MPNYKRQPSKKIKAIQKSSVKSVRDTLDQLGTSKLIGYIQRQNQRKSLERIASERFSEYSDKDKKKTQLRDADAPKSLQEKSSDTLQKVVKYLKAHKKPKDERAVRHINPRHLLLALAAVCLALIILSGVSEKVRTPFKNFASVFVVPAQKGINTIGLWLSDKLEAQKTLEQLEEDNQALREQINELNVTLTVLRQKEQELSHLQDLLVLKDTYADYNMEAAHIIAKDSGKWYSVFTIDKGTKDGIKKDMNVIASGGLVGIVIDAGPNFSTVRSIIDDDSSVSAEFQDNSDLCLINGSLSLMDQNLLEFTNVAGDVFITVNSAVVTSHVSSKYLPGILIGYVTDFQLEANDLTQSGHLKPVVDFSNLEEVLVITKIKETTN